MRKDAVANREKLLRAGREVFGGRGLGATLNDVAHAAGVGVGTAYRNFGNKQELLEAIFLVQVDELEAIARAALEVEDPWEGLRAYLTQATALQYSDKALAQMFAGRFVSRVALDASRDRVAPLVNRIGERVGVPGTDLIFIQVGVLAIADLVGDGYPRYLEIAIKGLQSGGELVGRALSTEETHEIMRLDGARAST
ncbi:TetR/AcrR family transcriptional regulator [Propionibacterium australiense]|uniref:Homeobox domain-like n=1 Tax=Propionibacterium australiense TaxID=119981 RepID=A0A383S775_9ACTN|nr:TetR family transcriptional regulator [Propionibacterium australiense]RLP09664.1 TetR family transcriptional regulator [Propionibacterium australiense]RLP12366.1 TetR family transcriptional regulator [Propionibacterium australiense]SYZ33571.1 Homeobox domain-like [Propionibacterium australiense]VEH89551.1 DNA-binding transcriptional regulator EnvR [Propionibacterium australiense]